MASSNQLALFFIFLVASSSPMGNMMPGIIWEAEAGGAIAMKSRPLLQLQAMGVDDVKCEGVPCDLSVEDFCQKLGCTQCIIPILTEPVCA